MEGKIKRKIIEDKLKERKILLMDLLDTIGMKNLKSNKPLGSTSEEIQKSILRAQIHLLEEILKGGE